jgi:hypothetical protein
MQNTCHSSTSCCDSMLLSRRLTQRKSSETLGHSAKPPAELFGRWPHMGVMKLRQKHFSNH